MRSERTSLYDIGSSSVAVGRYPAGSVPICVPALSVALTLHWMTSPTSFASFFQ